MLPATCLCVYTYSTVGIAEYGTTFLVVTHDRRIAQQTDRILEVLDGELVQDVRNEYVPAKE